MRVFFREVSRAVLAGYYGKIYYKRVGPFFAVSLQSLVLFRDIIAGNIGI